MRSASGRVMAVAAPIISSSGQSGEESIQKKAVSVVAKALRQSEREA